MGNDEDEDLSRDVECVRPVRNPDALVVFAHGEPLLEVWETWDPVVLHCTLEHADDLLKRRRRSREQAE